ncbi:cytochrome P450 [Ilyonectria destructans]|nr:cytochrome P450 [Ilyonectria destructans]
MYLRACFQEALRLSAADGISLPRGNTRGRSRYQRLVYTRLVLLGSGIYAAHHKEDHFSDPLTFRPQRWLPDRVGETELVNHDTKAYGPFSTGPQGGWGKGIAMNELMLAIAHVFFAMDFETLTVDGGHYSQGAGDR